MIEILQSFLEKLKQIEKLTGGNLFLIPRGDAKFPWSIQTTKGDEFQYIAWPMTDYVLLKLSWTQQIFNKYGLPWPFGDGLGANNLLDKYNPEDYINSVAAVTQLKRIFIKTNTIHNGREALEKGINMFLLGPTENKKNPNYLLWVLGGFGLFVLAAVTLKSSRD